MYVSFCKEIKHFCECQHGQGYPADPPGRVAPQDLAPRRIASNNSRKLQQLGAQVTINVDTATTPQRHQHEAEAAARSGDFHTQVSVPGRAIHAIPLLNELRTWDPAGIQGIAYSQIAYSQTTHTAPSRPQRCCVGGLTLQRLHSRHSTGEAIEKQFIRCA